MSQEFRQHAGRRRAFGPVWLACAISGAATALSLIFSGCLNPRPEELPSSQATVPESPAGPDDDNLFAPRPSETCDDNSLLVGCAAPAGGEPGSDGSSEPESDPEDSPTDLNRNGRDAGTLPGEAVVGLDAGLGGDAGAP